MSKYKWFLTILVVTTNIIKNPEASNLANPAIALPDARVCVGASYHLGGYTLTNLKVPSIFNRFHGRVEYGPIKYITLGIDLGTTQIEVDKYNDTIPIFHGKYGFSGGAHLKLSTPFFIRKTVALIAISQATLFGSENKFSAYYGGKDGCGTLALQVRIPKFGFISAGPLVYIIKGENRSYNGETGYYYNVNNLRGWIAIDYFPQVNELTKNRPYISIEASLSPEAKYSKRVFAKEFSISISIGAITRRLYGVESDVEWNP